MKKNYFSLLLALLLSMISTTALAYDAKIDGIYYNFNGTEAEVTYQREHDDDYLSDYSGDIIIPEYVEYNGSIYNVTSIGCYAFNDCQRITSISIPNTINSISYGAFWGCTSLSSINIPNGVTIISKNLFYECSSLSSIIIPYSVTKIEYTAFSDCGLTSIAIPNSVTTIENHAFQRCESLASVIIPNSVTSIGTSAFNGCISLTSVAVNIARPLTIDSYTFTNRANATLYVPIGCKSAYKTASYWKEFKDIIEKNMDAPICTTPVLTYQNGKIYCACETEDVKYVYSIIPTASTGENSDGVLELGTEFTVSVYATRDGYEDSEPATITIDLASVGDMNGDGTISIADVTGLVNVILGK